VDLSHQAKTEFSAKNTLKPVASDVFSNRKALWLTGFALSSAGFYLVSPGFVATLVFALAILLAHVVFVARARNTFLDSALFCTIAGSMQAAALLWVSVLVGNAGSGLIGLEGPVAAPLFAVALSVLSFAALVVAENVVAVALLFAVSKSHNAATDAACLIDMKCAGLFGETC